MLRKNSIRKEKPAWHILVVDEEPTICKTIKILLERDGHKVQTANDGKVALTLLEQNSFDLVTTEFSISDIQGDALAVAIKKRLPNLPIIMISANGAIEKSFGHPLEGVDLVISKPFLLADLRHAVSKVLARM